MAFPLVQLEQLPAKGKSIYAYSDNNVPTDYDYIIALKSVDIDRKFKYSGIIRLADGCLQ